MRILLIFAMLLSFTLQASDQQPAGDQLFDVHQERKIVTVSEPAKALMLHIGKPWHDIAQTLPLGSKRPSIIKIIAEFCDDHHYVQRFSYSHVNIVQLRFDEQNRLFAVYGNGVTKLLQQNGHIAK